MATVFKLENGLCRCCHSEGFFKDLGACISIDGDGKIYADLLKDCFDVNINQMDGEHSQVTYSICDTCIIKLEDAYNFKKQVIANEVMFQEIYNVQVVSALQPFPIKIEFTEVDDKGKEFDHNAADMHDFDDDFEYPESEEEEKTLKEYKEDQQTPKGKGKAKTTKTETKPKKSTTAKRKKGAKAEATSSEAKPTRKGMGHRGDEPIYYSVTSDAETGVNKYICTHCPKHFKELKYMVQHYRYVHLKQRTDSKCRICNENLPRYSKASHLEEVHGIPAPTCGICGKKFPFPNYLMIHQRNVHMREKNFRCTICGNTFFDNHGLQQHQLKHSEERKYKCQICDKKFTWMKNLRVHERIHTGVKPYTCKICSTGFSENKGLKRHLMKYHHDDKTTI